MTIRSSPDHADHVGHADHAPAFPMPRTCPYAPPREYAEMRARGPLVRVRAPNGTVVWVVTRWAEARQVLTDRRISTDSSRPDFPVLGEREVTAEQSAARDKLRAGFFIDQDPPEHDVLRRMLIPEFSVRRINQLRPRIQRITDERIDAMLAAGPPVDLVSEFGLPVPSMVICELLGVPYEDREFFQSRTRRMVASSTDPRAGMEAVMEIRNYLDDLVRRATAAPEDNLIGRLVRGPVAAGDLSLDALVGMAFLLLVAGHETTASMIPVGVFTLLRNPEQLAEVRADPDLWPGAVEELLRYQSVVDWVAFDRMAIEDLEIGGVQVRAGDGIFVLGASAGRDDRVFTDPDRLDVRRNARHHLAFGYGIHQCLGQNLARAELEIAYRTLFDRIPGLRTDVPDEELPFRYDTGIFGLYGFPVTW